MHKKEFHTEVVIIKYVFGIYHSQFGTYGSNCGGDLGLGDAERRYIPVRDHFYLEDGNFKIFMD
jgi:hypothetical protein